MEYPEFLEDKNIRRFERENNITYFRYIDELIMKKIRHSLDDEELEILSKGDSHAIVGDALYTKIYSNEKIKILSVNSIEMTSEGIILNAIYVPKGKCYRLVDKDFLKKKI